MKRFLLLVMLLLLVFSMFVLPAVALADDGAAAPGALTAFLVPFAWLVPIVVAVVNRVKDTYHPAVWILWAIGWAIGVTTTLIVYYFSVLPEPVRVGVAGTAVFLASAGIFDLFKTFGTFKMESVVHPYPRE